MESYGQRTDDANGTTPPGAHRDHPPAGDATFAENGLHPVELASDKIVSTPEHASYGQYNPVPLSADQVYGPSGVRGPPERRICGLGRAVFVLWCLLAVLVALLVVVAGVFGSMLARQSAEILDLKSEAPTRTSDLDTNGTVTGSAAAATTTWVQVSDWEFIGCWVDGEERVFPDKYQQIDRMTNKACASTCGGFRYFGSQFGDQCYCSNTPPETPAPAWNCDMHCAGAPNSEICGGYYFLSAWRRKT
ncbi:wsc domain containing protein [Colletotrichum musicola]|uniref:Wsc domain containing protein n=1 Tax=Colletotrichum musicola TaxID=2175873 RepID=A0A8H6JUL1_9PEZI|nr:wsc domain containing protein [Colletotrichum musicola]